MHIATATQMKNSFGKYLDLALKHGEVLIERHGMIVARLVTERNVKEGYSKNLVGLFEEGGSDYEHKGND